MGCAVKLQIVPLIASRNRYAAILGVWRSKTRAGQLVKAATVGNPARTNLLNEVIMEHETLKMSVIKTILELERILAEKGYRFHDKNGLLMQLDKFHTECLRILPGC